MMRRMFDMETSLEIEERKFAEVQKEFLNPKRKPIGALVYILLFFLFIAPQFDGLKSVPGIAVLVAVILFHEAGHMLGMWIFGFRDIRMFFIPFLGAAASGRPAGAAAWKHALVSLLGPLPGIVLGCVALYFVRSYPTTLFFNVIEVLIIVNVINLLPFGGLDGGRFLQTVLFSRHRLLEIVFLLVGSAALLGVATYLNAWVLAVFALFGLLMLPTRWKVLKAAAALRAQHPDIGPDPNKIGEDATLALYVAARQLHQPRRPLPAAAHAATMQMIADATQRPPGALASLGLLFLYAISCVVAFVGAILLFMQIGGPVDWKPYAQPGWRAEFPVPPQTSTADKSTPANDRISTITFAVVQGVEHFNVEEVAGRDSIEAEKWLDQDRDDVIAHFGATLRSETHIELGGISGREAELTKSYRTWRTRSFVIGNRLYRVTAAAPKWGENQRRFLDSFRLVPVGQ